MRITKKDLIIKSISNNKTTVGWLKVIKGILYGDYITYISPLDKEGVKDIIEFFNLNLQNGLLGRAYKPVIKNKKEFLKKFK